MFKSLLHWDAIFLSRCLVKYGLRYRTAPVGKSADATHGGKLLLEAHRWKMWLPMTKTLFKYLMAAHSEQRHDKKFKKGTMRASKYSAHREE